MARTFVATSLQRLRNGSFTGISAAQTLTLAGWTKRAATAQSISFGGERDVSSVGGFAIVHYTNDTLYFMPHNNAQTYGYIANSSNAWQHVCMRYDGNGATDADKLKGYIDGVQQSLTMVGPIPSTIGTTSAMTVGYDGGTGAYSDGGAAEIALYNAALTDAEIAALAASFAPSLIRPSALFAYWPLIGRATDEEDHAGSQALTNPNGATVSDHPRVIYPRRRTIISMAAATGYNIAAGTGAFTLTGNSANLLRARSIAAATGAFSLTGQAAGLTRSRLVTAATGVFSLTGVAAGLQFSRKVSASAGAFTFTGNAINLLRARAMAAGVGAFAFTGNAASLVYTPAGSYTMPAGTGAFALTGNAANLLASRRVTAGVGAFTFTGQAALFAYSKSMPAAAGAFTLIGQPANFLYSRVLHVNAGAFVLTGQPAALAWSNAPIVLPKVDPRYLARMEARNWNAKI